MADPTATTRPVDHDLVQGIRMRLRDQLAEVLDGARRVALVDFPYHRNAGDAAIWAGERALLAEMGVDVGYVADAGRFDARRLAEAVPEGPVLLSGGGNVGDLWPWSQRLREKVLTDLPDRHVVQLPQSVHFGSPDNAVAFERIVRAHGSYSFIARDAQSAERATTLGPSQVILAPDMAFGLGVLDRTRDPSVPVLALARDDLEGASGLRHHAYDSAVTADWSLGGPGALLWHATRLVPRVARLTVSSGVAWRSVAPLSAGAMDMMCRLVLARGVRLLSSARVVVTDRLHAHLLCVLLDIPHVVLDNSYGKISALHEQWTSTSRTTWWARSPEEALSLATSLSRTA